MQTGENEARSLSVPDRAHAWLLALLAAATAGVVLFQQIDLLDYRLWEDETETIVAARMMASGARLYDSIFNLHGPLVFLPAWLLALFGNPGIAGYRWAVIVLQWTGLAVLAAAPMAGAARVRIALTMAAAAAMVTMLPAILGHTFQYQTIAGIITLWVLALSVMPAIAGAPPSGRAVSVLTGMLLTSLPFLAVSYGPAAVLLFAAGMHRARLWPAALGVALGLAGNVAFLAWKGSITGYLAYHIYLNLRILPAFMPRNPAMAFISGLLSPEGLMRWEIRRGLTEALWVMGPCVLLWLLSTRAMDRRLPSWRACLTFLALASFLIRGSGFQATPFWYGILAIPLLALGPATALVVRRPWLAPASAAICLSVAIIGGIAQRPVLAARRIPPTTEFAELVRRLTAPDDRIIAYTFSNYQYVVADRLPASGYFFYLPLQAAYNAAPALGVVIDPCADIRAVRPRLMLITELRLYGFPRDHHDGCLGTIMETDYTRIDGKPYYIRNDLMPLPALGGGRP